MAYKPILFSTPMIKAIIEGRKSMTRRVINPQPVSIQPDHQHRKPEAFWTGEQWVKPKYQPGDILWVRETFLQARTGETYPSGEYVDEWCQNGPFEYAANGVDKPHWLDDAQRVWMGKRPSIFMPKEAARLFLRVTGVRAERLKEITVDDAHKEGFAYRSELAIPYQCDEGTSFQATWDRLNAKRGYGWDTNPWVWVYTFERIDRPADWPGKE